MSIQGHIQGPSLSHVEVEKDPEISNRIGRKSYNVYISYPELHFIE